MSFQVSTEACQWVEIKMTSVLIFCLFSFVCFGVIPLKVQKQINFPEHSPQHLWPSHSERLGWEQSAEVEHFGCCEAVILEGTLIVTSFCWAEDYSALVRDAFFLVSLLFVMSNLCSQWRICLSLELNFGFAVTLVDSEIPCWLREEDCAHWLREKLAPSLLALLPRCFLWISACLSCWHSYSWYFAGGLSSCRVHGYRECQLRKILPLLPEAA